MLLYDKIVQFRKIQRLSVTNSNTRRSTVCVRRRQ